MNRAQYIRELQAELARRGVSEIEDILDEYNEHFFCKQEEGCTEGEIAARLGDPREVAAQFAGRTEGPRPSRAAGVLAGCGVALGMLVLAALTAVLAALALCCTLAGLQLALDAGWVSLIPVVPHRLSGVALGLALLALALMAAQGCLWLGKLTAFCLGAYRSWLRGEGKRSILPSLHRPRLFLVSCVVFLALLASGFAISAALAGNIEFWHVWNWFGGA